MAVATEPVKIIYLAESDAEIETVRQKLPNGLFCSRVINDTGSEDDYHRILSSDRYDMILADYPLPGDHTAAALRARLWECPDIPFVCLGNAVGEEAVVDLIKQGVTDYVRKDRLDRLPAAVARALDRVRIAESAKELQNARKLARDIADATPSMTAILDRDLKCSWLDRQCTEFVGMPVDSLLGDGWRKFVHPDDHDLWFANGKPKLANQVIRTECRVLRHDGSYRWVLVQATPHTDIENNFLGFIVCLVDITEQKNTQAELKQINHYLKEAQRIAHIGSWDWDILTGKLYWSDESYRLLGLAPSSEPMPTGLHLERMAPEEQTRVTEARNRAIENHEPFDVTYCISALDGKTKFIHSLGRAVYDIAGRPIYMSGTMQDVTERKLAEMELQRHLDFQQVIFRLSTDFINMPIDRLEESMTDALGMVGKYCGSDRVTVWKFDHHAAVAIRLFGWEKVKSRPVGLNWDMLPFDSLPSIIDLLIQGKAVLYGDGQIRWTESEQRKRAEDRYSSSFNVIPLISGGIAFGMLMFSTIETPQKFSPIEVSTVTIFSQMIMSVLHRKEQEEELLRLVESNRLTLESITDGVAMLDRDFTILTINSQFAQRYGKTPAEAIGTNALDYMPSMKYRDLGETRLQKLDAVFESGKEITFEDCRDGKWFRNRYYPVFKDGKVAAITLFSADITGQKRADEESRIRMETEARLNVMTEFFTNVSHELRTPLSLILMQLDMMRMHAGDRNKVQDLMNDATLNCYRLTRLVSNLLDITKMDSGFLKLNLRNRDVVSLLKSVCESVAAYATARGIALCFHCDAQSKRMDLDNDKLERILLNLLSNAIKHTPKGGSISVTLTDRQDRVLISVRDTGVGIPKERLNSIFDRFVQVSNGFSRPAEGCGIGLALVKSMAELHGGRVWAESEPGKGSVFVVELPARSVQGRKATAVIEGFDLDKKVKMELSDLYIKVEA